MTTEEKIKMFNGETAAMIDRNTDRFICFATIYEKGAAKFLADPNTEMGVSVNGHFWMTDGDIRYVFPNKDLQAIIG